jgi:16S rRNA A1518/A1519 N6-dimethyltransferase RsmA/KsgA/DIM1 with predicted DNA glycosylase/AP lyase activity
VIIGDAKRVGFLDANKIVSNLPYNMTDWLFDKLNNSDFELAVVTIPLKFFNNQSAKYENIECKIIKELLPSDFYPQPRIKSAIVKIIKK